MVDEFYPVLTAGGHFDGEALAHMRTSPKLPGSGLSTPPRHRLTPE